jgi:protein arginine N-methyltransferase 1
MSLVVDAHREYLSDPVRVQAYERAIAAAVRPGDIVVDMGAGTGILGMLACRAGAARVYAIEADGMIEVARALAQANGVADRFVFLMRHSSEVRLPQQVDVIAGDLIGHMGFEAGVFEAYAHARRWLKPGARVIPSAITICASPVEHPAAHADVEFWRQPVAGFDARAVLPWARNTGYPRMIDPRELLSEDHASATFSPVGPDAVLRLRDTVTVSRAGTMHGIGAWFSALLALGVEMTNAPGAPSRINRRNVFLPLHPAVAVVPGDRVTIDIRIRPVDLIVNWTVDVTRASAPAGVVRMRHSTLGGMLLTREDLRSHAPSSRPRLTPRGEARRTLLALCDGARPLEEIEREVFRQHPALFATPGDAQAFVAEVVARYGVFD